MPAASAYRPRLPDLLTAPTSCLPQLKVVRAIESTKLTTKKRKGVAPFVKFFPVRVSCLARWPRVTLLTLTQPASPQVFIDRFESQLVGTDGLQIRKIVDTSYERIANTIFDSLQQMAKMDGADGLAAEDKGQLNYHVILIGALPSFVAAVVRRLTLSCPPARREHALPRRRARVAEPGDVQRADDARPGHLPRQPGLLHAPRPAQAAVPTDGASSPFSSTPSSPGCER